MRKKLSKTSPCHSGGILVSQVGGWLQPPSGCQTKSESGSHDHDDIQRLSQRAFKRVQ